MILALLTMTFGHALASDPPTFLGTRTYVRLNGATATYYVYEREKVVICTTLRRCTSDGRCEVDHVPGAYLADEDERAGAPAATTAAAVIPEDALRRHRCLRLYEP